ncbi:UpxY family transcription antiterminator [Prevotella dentasini]|uniref:UpxY family transcription antiterminator n=1 Tax=Prevotella dentasini TaxID=589537 RepID=UPI00046815DB|nr:UpxY family transcription antiterminator [Prevotella dentasini]
MEKLQRYVDEVVDDGKAWYAVRLFGNRQETVADYFKEKGMEVFIPLQYRDVEDASGKVRQVLRPVVINLLFVKQPDDEAIFRKAVQESALKLSVIRKERDSKDYYLIPHNQMYEFRLMCNPEISMRKFISTEEARMKAGDPVLVKFGPMKGMTGRLVRSSKKYFLLKEIPGISVMLKVTKWCCVPLSETGK